MTSSANSNPDTTSVPVLDTDDQHGAEFGSGHDPCTLKTARQQLREQQNSFIVVPDQTQNGGVMTFFLVEGPDYPWARERLEAALAAMQRERGNEYSYRVVSENRIVFSNTRLSDSCLAERHDARRLLESLRGHQLFTVADAQRRGALETWRAFAKATNARAGESPPFWELCREMAGLSLQFIGGPFGGLPAALLTMGKKNWMEVHGVDTYVASILFTNAIGGAALLSQLTDEDIGGLWHIGEGARRQAIIELRDSLRGNH